MEYLTRAVADSIVIRGASPLNRAQFKLSKITSYRLGRPDYEWITGDPDSGRQHTLNGLAYSDNRMYVDVRPHHADCEVMSGNRA